MGDYGIDEDYDGPVYHRIRCSSDWPTCFGAHETAAEVRDCFRRARVVQSDPDRYFPCTWTVRIPAGEGEYLVTDCGALVQLREDGTGYDCEAGHEHTYAEARRVQGWEYAEDEDEAKQLARAGVEPRTMAGQVWA